MNILYISHLSTNIAAGPNWSVPARVKAQAKYDNVLLLNTTNVMMEHWKTVGSFHNLNEFGELKLKNLPEPFSRPDVVVFEGFNFMEHVRFAKDLKKIGIPYIVTPRGAMTYEAQHNHAWLKKTAARWLFLRSFVNNAVAIQYLTKGEYERSVRMFNAPHFILPNGFNEPQKKKTVFSKKGIKAVFIGRIDMYHKGLDLLLKAIASIKDNLSLAGFTLSIYGPRRYDFYKIEELIKALNIGSVVSLHNEISGNDKERVLLSSDLFVMTSRLEGLPMGLLEAFAYGLPCLITQGTNMKDEVERFDAGWTCMGNENEIKENLIKIIEEGKCLPLKGSNAISLSQCYLWDNIAVRFHDKVSSLISPDF